MTRTALITGTSSGIGLATAVLLAKAGYAVTATMRDTRRADDLLKQADVEGVTLDVQPLDVTKDDSASSAIAGFMERHGRLDVLVNNAGAGHLGTTEQVSIQELQHVFDVNLYGVWRVVQAVLPHMRQAGGGRIINISSGSGLLGEPFNDAYGAAKFAVEGMTECLAPVALQFGVHVCLIEPGPVNTHFLTNISGMERLGDENDPYRPLMLAYAADARRRFAEDGQTPAEVAQVVVQAATDDHPKLRYQTSPMIRNLAAHKLVDPDGYMSLETASRALGLQ